MASGSSTLDDGERRGSLADEGVDLSFLIGSDGRRRSVRFTSDDNIIPSRNPSLLVPVQFASLRPVSEHVLTPVPSPLPPEFSHRGSTTSESLRDDQYLVETLLIKILDDLNNGRIGRPDVHYLTACCVQADWEKTNDVRDVVVPPMSVINSLVNFCLEATLKIMTSGSMNFDDLCKVCASLFTRGRRASSVGEDLTTMMKRAGLIHHDVSEASRLLRIAGSLDTDELNIDDLFMMATLVTDACEWKGKDVLSGIRGIIKEMAGDKLKVGTVSASIISSYDVIIHRKQEEEMTWIRDTLEQVLIHHVFTGTVREKIQNLTERFEKKEVTPGEEVVEDIRNLLLNAGKKVFAKRGNQTMCGNPKLDLKFLLDCVEKDHLQEEYFWEAGQCLEDFFSDVLLCPVSVMEARTRIVVEKLRLLKEEVDNGRIPEKVISSVISSLSPLSAVDSSPTVQPSSDCPKDSVTKSGNITTERILKNFLQALEDEEVGYDEMILVLGNVLSLYGENGEASASMDEAGVPGAAGGRWARNSGGWISESATQVQEILERLFNLLVQTIISDVISSLPDEKTSVKVVEAVVRNELFGHGKSGSTGLQSSCDQLVRNYIDQVAQDLSCCRAETKSTKENKLKGYPTLVVDFIGSVLECTISKVKSSAIASSDLAPILSSLTQREMEGEIGKRAEEVLLSMKSDLGENGLESTCFKPFVTLICKANNLLDNTDLQIIKSFTESVVAASLNYTHNAPVEQLGVTMDTELTSLPCQGFIRRVIDDALEEVMTIEIEDSDDRRKSCILDVLKRIVDNRRTRVLDKDRKSSDLASGLEVAIINCLEGLQDIMTGRTNTPEVTEDLLYVAWVMQDMIDVKLAACRFSINKYNRSQPYLQSLKDVLSTIEDGQFDRQCQSVLIPPKTWLLLSQICIQVLDRTIDWITNMDSREQLVVLAEDITDKDSSSSPNSFQSMNGAMLKEYITETLMELNARLKSGRVEESSVCRMVVQIITSGPEQPTNQQPKSLVAGVTSGVTIETAVTSILSSLIEKIERGNHS